MNLTEKYLTEKSAVSPIISQIIAKDLKKATDDILKHDDLSGDKIAMDALRKFVRFLRSHGIK